MFSDTKGAVPDETYRYDGPHLSEYDRTKWIAHYRVALPKMDEGLPLSIVMPGLVYGPGDTSGMHTALVDLLRGRLPMTPAQHRVLLGARRRHRARAHPGDGEGQARRDLHHRRARGTPSSRRSIWRRRSPRCARRCCIPARTRCARWPRLMRRSDRFVTLPPAFTPEALRVLAGTTYFGSNEKAVRELGFAARPLEEGLAQTLEHELRLLGRV